MLTSFLVPLDGSAAEAGLPCVELVACRSGATLHLLAAVGEEVSQERA